MRGAAMSLTAAASGLVVLLLTVPVSYTVRDVCYGSAGSEDDADREKAEGVQVFTALKESVDRALTQLMKEIEEKHKAQRNRQKTLSLSF